MPPLPGSWRVGRSPDALHGSGILLGGSPPRVIRLAGATAAAVDLLFGGSTVDETSSACGFDAGPLARRLVEDGFGWADPPSADPSGMQPPAAAVTVVVPVRDGADELARLLGDAPRSPPLTVIIVDDGSIDTTSEVAAALGAKVRRHPEALGPAAARNTGWRAAGTPFVLFADADATLPDRWEPALAHFADPTVGVVVPRVHPGASARAGGTVASRSRAAAYDAARFPYDLGPSGGDIGAGRRLDYATSVLLFARVEALASIGGFAADLRFGEDLDLIRRLESAGWSIRYEPRCSGAHQTRDSLLPLLLLHHRYGRPLAELSRRSGPGAGLGSTTTTALAAMSLALCGAPAAATAAACVGATVGALSLRRRGLPRMMAARLGIRTEVRAIRTATAAATGAWLPVVVPVTLALLLGRRSRRAAVGCGLLAGATCLRHLADWRVSRPGLRPGTWVGLRTLDDLAGATGTWLGCLAAGAFGPVLPRIFSVGSGPTMPDATRSGIEGWTELAVLGWSAP